MFLNKEKFFLLSGFKKSILNINNNFIIIDWVSSDFSINNNLIFFLNIKRLKVKKFFFKANYYIIFKELDFINYLNLIDELTNEIIVNGIIFNNQYLNIVNENAKMYLNNFLYLNNNFLYLYIIFFNILIILNFFLKKIFFLINKLC
jgi:hypothetical protein